jgi:hypothetical protein
MKITLRLAESKSILTCASVVRSAPAKVPMGRFSMVVRGTQSRWFPLTIGKQFMASHFPTRHLHLPHKSGPQMARIEIRIFIRFIRG